MTAEKRKTPKTIHTAARAYEWRRWEAALREDDSLIVERHSQVQGENTGSRLRFENTGLLGKLGADPEMEPAAAIDHYIFNADTETATVLRRGETVR